MARDTMFSRAPVAGLTYLVAVNRTEMLREVAPRSP